MTSLFEKAEMRNLAHETTAVSILLYYQSFLLSNVQTVIATVELASNATLTTEWRVVVLPKLTLLQAVALHKEQGR